MGLVQNRSAVSEALQRSLLQLERVLQKFKTTFIHIPALIPTTGILFKVFVIISYNKTKQHYAKKMKGTYISVPDNEFSFYISLLERFKTATVIKTDDFQLNDSKEFKLLPWQIAALNKIIAEDK